MQFYNNNAIDAIVVCCGRFLTNWARGVGVGALRL